MSRTKLLAPLAALAFAGIAACAAGPTTPTPTGKPNLYHASTCSGEVAVPDQFVGNVAVEAAVLAVETLVGVLQQAAGLTCGQVNSLLHKIEAALAAAARGECNAAVNILNAFVNEVEAILRVSRLAEPTLNQVQNVVRGLANVICPLEPTPF